MFGTALMMPLLGYDLFITGGWSIKYFFLDYTFLAVFPLSFVGWKFLKRTRYVKAGTADLTVDGLVLEIDEYETTVDPQERSQVERWFGLRLKKKHDRT